MHNTSTRKHSRGDGNARLAPQPSSHAPDRDESTAECERLLDDALDGTFPASDPPSWTMGVRT